MSTMNSWAEKEIELACKREKEISELECEWDYGCACYESALKAFKSLCEDGHSGQSIMITLSILNKLVEGKPLTPIEDTPDIWNLIYEEDGKSTYQCRRMSRLFKDVDKDGNISFHDSGRVIAIEMENGSTWHSGLCTKLIEEMFPIKMPYYPNSEYEVYMKTCTEDENGNEIETPGTYNTVYISHIITPEKDHIEVNRKWQEDENGHMVEVKNKGNN